VVLIGGLVAAHPDPVNVPSVAEMQQSVVDIRGSKDGEDVLICSGYIRKKDHSIVTAAHCLDDGVAYRALINGKYVNVSVLKKGDQKWLTGPDLALLVGDVPATVAGLEECSSKAQLGNPLVEMGSPLGVKGGAAFGHLSNTGIDISEYFGEAPYSKHFLGFDGQQFKGNSGGPVVDYVNGCVVGIAEAVLGGESYGINLLTPISDLGALNG
jgi:S1-C subfamily serine protease